MAYELSVLFAEAKDINEAYRIAHNFVDRISLEDMKEIIKENSFFIPSRQMKVTEENKDAARKMDQYWIYPLLSFRFIFWEKQHLLGFVSEDTRKWGAVLGHPERNYYVLFQNSSDHDYDFTDWPTSIPFFDKAVKKYRSILTEPGNKIIEFILGNSHIELNDDELCDTEYWVKTLLYHHISSELHISEILSGAESKNYKRFALSAIRTPTQELELQVFVDICAKEKLKIVND